MSSDESLEEHREFPTNWDVLNPSAPDDDLHYEEASDEKQVTKPPTINVLASSWADAVAALAVCTAALFGLNAAGFQGLLTALPWAAILGVTWWVIAAAILVAIRQGTPGMLLAGVHFGGLVPSQRVVAVVVTAAVCALFLGLPGLLPRSPLAYAAACDLEPVPTV